jgi:hypothetical protein
MRKYKDWRPTQFDSKGLNGEENGISDFLVLPVSQNRDSGIFQRCNFKVALDMLGGESDNVQVHRFGHWGPGWFEIILVNPADPKSLKIAEGIESKFENYPLLNEDVFSEMEFQEINDYWAGLRTADRVDYCKREGLSIFSANPNHPIPERIWEHLASEMD